MRQAPLARDKEVLFGVSNGTAKEKFYNPYARGERKERRIREKYASHQPLAIILGYI